MDQKEALARTRQAYEDMFASANVALKLGVPTDQVAESTARGFDVLPEDVRLSIWEEAIAQLPAEAKQKALIELLASFTEEERQAILATLSGAAEQPTAPSSPPA